MDFAGYNTVAFSFFYIIYMVGHSIMIVCYDIFRHRKSFFPTGYIVVYLYILYIEYFFIGPVRQCKIIVVF